MNLSGALPKGTPNGLAAIEQHFVHDEGRKFVVIAVMDCRKLTTDLDTGDVVPTARIRSIEPILKPADLKAAKRLLARAASDHTGEGTLPLDLKIEIDDAFVDLDSGELSGGDGEG